jgi:NADH-quinone oxidoreductase subunit E
MKIIKTVTIDCESYLSKAEMSEIEHEVSIMETRESAGIEALKVVQTYRGWISDDSLKAIAEFLHISSAELEGVATFYNLIYRQPVGRHVIHICNSISCHLTGYQQVLSAIKEYLNIDYGQTTSDQQFTLLSNACLGSCDKSPAMMIGKNYYENLTANKAIAVLKEIKSNFSTNTNIKTSTGTRTDESENSPGVTHE